ncbi:S-phase kinase-associated protein 1A [Achlya hypogyna]|uniref:S-phase kinase-associated protein 1A n=1 Tax=Achlya hypogyna TaxID=1202772 RepID=A0A1V9YIN2_ACHHY|nr:S-phase kinase-associated protein 1A [Achlya hypogyna]
MSTEERKVNLVSQDGDSFEVTQAVACVSELVKTMIADEEDEDGVREIPLPNVKSPVLAKVIEFCAHHVNNPMADIEKPLKSGDLADVVSEWDAAFVDIDQEVLFEVILAANYMDIKSLLDLACAKVATLIKGKTSDEIREMFHIEKPVEEEAVAAAT